MNAFIKSRLTWAISLPAIIFLSCILITFTAKFRANPQQLSIPLMLDLLLTAPLAYYLVIRKSSVPKITVLRVFMAGLLIAGAILSKGNNAIFTFAKTWLAPLAEAMLIGFITWKLYTSRRQLKNATGQQDFLVHCRALLTSVSGSAKLANIFASEIAVFYYTFAKRDKNIDDHTKFTCYRENGLVLVLGTFLALFIIETAGMHFLLLLWSKTAAWILTGLGFYSCLQLFAHLRALQARPIQITNNHLHLRNGLLGGDVLIGYDNIEKVEKISRSSTAGMDTVKLAFIKGLENHNTAIYLVRPVAVVKAFGIQKTAKVVSFHVDKQEAFIKSLEQYINGYPAQPFTA